MSAAADSMLVPIIAAAVAAGAWLVLARRAAPAASHEHLGPPAPRRATGSWIRIALAMAIAAFVWGMTDRPSLALLAAVLWLGASGLLRSRRRNRLELREEQHAIEAIGAASRALRAGIPVSGMLEFLSHESRGEARRAFQEVVHREGVGEELGAAIRQVLLRSPLPALRAFGLTILSQLGSGGDIADTTDRLARSLIDRARVRRRARTIMAYTRAAATLLAVLPAIVVPMMCYLMDDYARFMLHTPTGNALLATSGCLVVGGTLLMQRLSRLEPARVGVAR
jgi:Flp pilus assembly protein TadB